MNARPRRPATRHTTSTILVGLLCALLAAAPLWGPGIVNTRGGGDSPFLLQRTLDMAENLRHGIFPPRWMTHAAYDLGYPFFHHYAALPYYLSGGLAALGVNVLSAIQITQTLGFIIAALAMGLWSRRLFHSPAAQGLAVAAYTFAPFHLVNVYVRGDSLSEFYAFAWYPLILWALDRVVERRAGEIRFIVLRRITTAALAYGALILTHNISAMIFSPFALLYAVAAAYHAHRPGAANDEAPPRGPALTALTIVTPFALGILLTAWFWAPAIIEIQYGQMGDAFTGDYFHYSNHFRTLDLIQPSLAFDYTVATAVGEPGPFTMGLVQALLGAAGTAVMVSNIIRRRAGAARKLAVLLALLGATVMITPLSRVLWDKLPLLALAQFPWRFLSVQAVFTAAATGAVVTALTGEARAGRRSAAIAVALIGVVLVAAAALAGLRPERLAISAGDVTWDTLLLYESFTGNIGTTIRHEYLPRDVVPRLYISEAVIDGVDQGAPIADSAADGSGYIAAYRLLDRTPVQQRWEIELAGGATPVAFPLNAWPGWEVTVNGDGAESWPMPGSGRLTAVLPDGQSRVELRLRPTPLRRWSGAASAVTAAALLFALVRSQSHSRSGRCQLHMWGPVPSHSRSGRCQPHSRSGRCPTVPVPGERLSTTVWKVIRLHTLRSIALSSTILLIAAVGPLLLQRTPGGALPSDAVFFDFHRMPYPHRGPVDFGVAQLTAVRYPGRSQAGVNVRAAPGETLAVTLHWQDVQPAAPPMTVTLRLVSPAEPRHNVPYTLTTTSAPLTAPTTEMQMALPGDLARGLYLIQVTLAGERGELAPHTFAPRTFAPRTFAPRTFAPHTQEGRIMGALYAGALRVQAGPQPGPAILATVSDLRLHAVKAAQPDPRQLRLAMTWSLNSGATPRNWRLSLRLLDAGGRQIVQQDLQPGYGYLPTTLWRPDQAVTDYPVLALPEGLAPGDYTLRVVTYLLGVDGDAGGQVDVPLRLTSPTLYDLRDACCEQARKGRTILCGTGELALLNLHLPASVTEGDDLGFEAEWNALLKPTEDLTATWTLSAPDGTTAAEVSAPLAAGSRPTAWPRHTWVLAPYNLDLPPDLDAGTYALGLTLRSSAAARAQCDAVATVEVQARPRAFEAPPLAHDQAADFGTVLRLLGYDMGHDRRARRLTLTLWWQAADAPARDYKRFVHLYDPATEAVPVQSDAMPRDWRYPTASWAAGEVVSETVTLDLAGVPAGDYRLGVGWYDPETLDRLPAAGPDGTPIPMDRVTLTTGVTVRP